MGASQRHRLDDAVGSRVSQSQGTPVCRGLSQRYTMAHSCIPRKQPRTGGRAAVERNRVAMNRRVGTRARNRSGPTVAPPGTPT